jgi:hypothetical protein
VVEVSPPYDVGDITSILGVRVINDVLGTLVEAGKLGKRPKPAEEQAPDEGGTDETVDNQPGG